MVKSSENEEVLKWGSEQPELLEALRRFREMEGDLNIEAGGVDALELELLEMVKAIHWSRAVRALSCLEGSRYTMRPDSGVRRHL